MKRKILVATDFSIVSRNAYLYARELAKVFNCRLEVLHGYNTAISNNTVAALMTEAGTVRTAKKKMKEFVEDFPDADGEVMTEVEVNTNIVESSAVSLLVKESAVENVFMIVMGTPEKHKTIERIIGSIPSKVAQKAHCPVLLVPEMATYRPFNRILFASNFESSQEDVVKEIADFANVFRAAIHFIHVKEIGEDEDFLLTEQKIFGALFKDGDPAFSFTMDELEADSVVDGLLGYAQAKSADLIALANRQRDCVSSIRGKSLSMKMALTSKFPLLVYHI